MDLCYQSSDADLSYFTVSKDLLCAGSNSQCFLMAHQHKIGHSVP